MLLRSCPESDFETSVLQPAAMACSSRLGVLKLVNISSGREGCKRLSSRAASKPFMHGMERSKSTRSGLSSLIFLNPFLSVRCLTEFIGHLSDSEWVNGYALG